MADLSGQGWEVPGSVKDRVEFHWFHVPVGGCLLLGVLSAEPAWYVGHFHEGRMRRCEGHECALCALGIGRQLRYVLSCVELRTQVIGVLEVGTSCGQVVKDYAVANGGCRGAVLEVTRAGRSKHSRLEVAVLREYAGPGVLAIAPLDLEAVLRSTWDRQRR